MIGVKIHQHNGLVSLNFNRQNFGFQLFHGQVDTPQADLCFSNLMITHSF